MDEGRVWRARENAVREVAASVFSHQDSRVRAGTQGARALTPRPPSPSLPSPPNLERRLERDTAHARRGRGGPDATLEVAAGRGERKVEG